MMSREMFFRWKQEKNPFEWPAGFACNWRWLSPTTPLPGFEEIDVSMPRDKRNFCGIEHRAGQAQLLDGSMGEQGAPYNVAIYWLGMIV